MKKHRSSRIVWAFRLVAALAFPACTFPEYITPDATTSSTTASVGGGASTSSASTSASTTDGSTSSAGGGGASSTSTSTSTSSSSSSSASGSSTGSGTTAVCSEPCDPSGGATCVVDCVASSMDPDCDCDGDGEIIDTAGCKTAHAGAPIDCYDCNKNAKHGQIGYFVDDRGDGDYDYDCNNLEEPQYTTVCGEGLLSCSKPFRYDVTPGCGKNGNLFGCTAIVNVLACTKASVSNVTPQSCH